MDKAVSHAHTKQNSRVFQKCVFPNVTICKGLRPDSKNKLPICCICRLPDFCQVFHAEAAEVLHL